MSFKRSRPPEAPQLPPQPPAPELLDIIDEISGVQTITVTGPDGKKRRVTQRLPLTQQEQQMLTQAQNLIDTAVNNIERLYKYDPNSVVNYQPFIQAFSNINNERIRDLNEIGNFKDIAEKVEQFRTMNRDLAVRQFESDNRKAEELLARRGIARSTEASELRAAMARERGLLEQQADVNAQNYGEDLKNKQLARESNLYSLKESSRQGRLQEAEAAYNLEKQKLADIEAARQGAINENLNLLNVGEHIKGVPEKAKFGLATSNNALNLFNAQANNQNQRYANEINRIQNQYALDLNRYQSTPASFGQKLVDLGLSVAGQAGGRYLGNKMSGFMGESPTVNPAPAVNQSPATFGGNIGRQQTFNQLRRVGTGR